MKTARGALILMLCIGANYASLIQFGGMIRAKSRVPPLAYIGYGNFCGLFGKGEELDNIDRCCSEHDKCLFIARRKNCNPFFYFAFFIQPYKWYMKNGQLECAPVNPKCAQGLCECDRVCAECFARYDDQYDPKLKRRLRLG